MRKGEKGRGVRRGEGGRGREKGCKKGENRRNFKGEKQGNFSDPKYIFSCWL